ncbi:MAG: hypothetical protein OEV26_05520 [Gallionella sp.]|nr:hypothetical protein [Gallionella sp.]MDH4286865.1 hypothetical protein [Gallionella sp.]
MIILRLFIVLILLLLVISGGMYVFTRQRRYLDFAMRTLKFAVMLLLVFALLFILERYVLVGWKILL